MKCPKCGIEIPEDSLFCPECGAKIAATTATKPHILLWVLLGIAIITIGVIAALLIPQKTDENIWLQIDSINAEEAEEVYTSGASSEENELTPREDTKKLNIEKSAQEEHHTAKATRTTETIPTEEKVSTSGGGNIHATESPSKPNNGGGGYRREPIPQPINQQEEEEVFMVVQTMPGFPGGNGALFNYLSQNIRYPVEAQEAGAQGRVICQFIVEKDGTLTNVEVARSSGNESLDKEAVRVVKSMPKWNPGKQEDKVVRVKYTLPVSFKL